MRKFILILLLIPVVSFSQPMRALIAKKASSGGNGYSYWRTITIDKTKVPNTDQSNFPMLFSSTVSSLRITANGGRINTTGLVNGVTVPMDLIFTSDAGGTSLLNWEIEKYDASTGEIVVWIKIPTLSNTVNTVIYMFYGKSGVVTYQGGSKGSVYDANYLAVWHGNNSGSDATSNSANLTANGSGTPYATAKIGDGLSTTNANGNYFNFSSISLSSNYTIECWANISAANNTSIIFGVSGSNPNTNFFNGQYRLYNGSSDEVISSATTSTGTWVHLVITRTSGGIIRVYNNGSESGSNTSGAARTFTYLARTNTTNSANIKLDEVRISNVVRSADWIATQYNNQNSPSTFYTIGAEN